MYPQLIGTLGLIASCVIASGCSKSNQFPQEIVAKVAEQAAEVATIRVELETTKKSLADAYLELDQARPRLKALTETEGRLTDLLRLAEESKQQAQAEAGTLKSELWVVSEKLRKATAKLDQIDATRREQEAEIQSRARIAPVLGSWSCGDGIDRVGIAFREDRTGRRKTQLTESQFEYRPTSDPLVFDLEGTWRSLRGRLDTVPEHKLVFRINKEGTVAFLEEADGHLIERYVKPRTLITRQPVE